MSSIGWVDFSSEDRERVQNLLALLKQKGTLDELGIGQVRDAFSEQLFPGFSTIQTSARYFLAIPKILRDWASLKDSERAKTPLQQHLKKAENDLAKLLKSSHETNGLPLEGIIGHTLTERGGAERLPSSTYWNGLRVFGLVKTDLSLSEFTRSWGHDLEPTQAVDADDGSDDVHGHIETAVCLPPGGRKPWAADLSLRLSRTEADYLADKFRHASGREHSVAAQLIASGKLAKAVSGELEAFGAFSAWTQTQHKLSQPCRDMVLRAAEFSTAMEGAHIVYNRLLAELTGNAHLRSTCARRFTEWRERAKFAGIFHKEAHVVWLSAALDAKTPVRKPTKDFLHSWNNALVNGATDAKLDAIVSAQAKGNKPGRSLLIKPPKKHENWYGMDTLEYRWRTARGMLSEIHEGLQC